MLCGSIMVCFISVGHPPLGPQASAPLPHLGNGAAMRQLSAHSLPFCTIIHTCLARPELSPIVSPPHQHANSLATTHHYYYTTTYVPHLYRGVIPGEGPRAFSPPCCHHCPLYIWTPYLGRVTYLRSSMIWVMLPASSVSHCRRVGVV